jgi:3-deoxy-manno-octulosonate cytidylyltransferase (CMP-KDO synthetase)
MKIFAVIPCRYESTRFEGKPLALISGKPMIQHVYERAVMSHKVDEVVVATDDRRICKVVEQFNGRVVMTSVDNRSGTDRVAEAAESLGLAMDDIVINVQGDQPMIAPASLDAVAAPLVEDPLLEMSTLACTISDHLEYTNPKDCKVVTDHKGYALYFSRAPIPYVRDPGDRYEALKHLGVYGYRRSFLEIFRRLPLGRCEAVEKLEQLRVLEFGHRIMVVVSEHDSPEVDLPEDIRRIEQLLSSKGIT